MNVSIYCKETQRERKVNEDLKAQMADLVKSQEEQARGGKGYPALLALFRDEGSVRAWRRADRVLRDRRLHAELPGPSRQLYRGQPAGDAGAHRS